MKFIANSLLNLGGLSVRPGCHIELDADAAAPLLASGFIYPDPTEPEVAEKPPDPAVVAPVKAKAKRGSRGK